MIHHFSVFFPNENGGNNNNPFWALGGKIRALVLNSPVTFCAGIGPLQLGIVLVTIYNQKAIQNRSKTYLKVMLIFVRFASSFKIDSAIVGKSTTR